jgi:hypothetical protein
VTPAVGWPDQLTLVARAVSAARIRVSVCNATADTLTTPDPASQSFRYVAFAA